MFVMRVLLSGRSTATESSLGIDGKDEPVVERDGYEARFERNRMDPEQVRARAEEKRKLEKAQALGGAVSDQR
jgi:hypothetical protein